MTARQTCSAYELTDDTYAFNNGAVQKIVKAFTVGDRTTIIDGRGDSFRIASSTAIELATEDEAAEHEREQDRLAVADALRSLGDKILSRSLPVPVGGRGIVVSFDLADDSDLEPWSRWLSKRPQRGTSRPHIQAEAGGVEVYVYGPGTSGEFGPDLADAALTDSEIEPVFEVTKVTLLPDVEHRDSVGAFPVVPKLPPLQACARCGCAALLNAVELCTECEVELALKAADEMRAEENAPERDGWPISDGHRPPVDDAAMRADRYNGEG